MESIISDWRSLSKEAKMEQVMKMNMVLESLYYLVCVRSAKLVNLSYTEAQINAFRKTFTSVEQVTPKTKHKWNGDPVTTYQKDPAAGRLDVANLWRDHYLTATLTVDSKDQSEFPMMEPTLTLHIFINHDKHRPFSESYVKEIINIYAPISIKLKKIYRDAHDALKFLSKNKSEGESYPTPQLMVKDGPVEVWAQPVKKP